jgi:nucleoside-diphosphate-sugar epimerase
VTNVLILGANGFIGSHLCEKVLEHTDWGILALDIRHDNLEHLMGNPRFRFHEAPMSKAWDWIEEGIKESFAVVPLAGIARPAMYIEDPLFTYELDFEENLKVVRACAEAKRWVVFPSTSEVYGMSPDPELKEDESPLVLGPIRNVRWIYSCSKQMMDRVIWALGQSKGLPFTLFRPFNWIGPRQDDPRTPKGNRLVPQLLGNLMRREPLRLVNGGTQRRSFTDIEEGVMGIMAILKQPEASVGEIFNLGNPKNNHSVREVAEALRQEVSRVKGYEDVLEVPIVEVSGEEHYGKGYEDVKDRLPSIAKAVNKLHWEPKLSLRDTLRKTVDYYLR